MCRTNQHFPETFSCSYCCTGGFKAEQATCNRPCDTFSQHRTVSFTCETWRTMFPSLAKTKQIFTFITWRNSSLIQKEKTRKCDYKCKNKCKLISGQRWHSRHKSSCLFFLFLYLCTSPFISHFYLVYYYLCFIFNNLATG